MTDINTQTANRSVGSSIGDAMDEAQKALEAEKLLAATEVFVQTNDDLDNPVEDADKAPTIQ